MFVFKLGMIRFFVGLSGGINEVLYVKCMGFCVYGGVFFFVEENRYFFLAIFRGD